MTEEIASSESSLPKHYIDQMSAFQRMITEPQRELLQLRQDAKTDGLNVDALNILTQVRSRSLPDGGTKILNDVVEYAIGIGIQFDQVTPQHAWEHVEKQHSTGNLTEEYRPSPADQRLLDRVRFSGQLALGAILSAAMLWYLQ